jgi:transcriptional regulator with XRE-family HTH domain
MEPQKRAAAERFGANLRGLRLEKGISPRQLGSVAGVSHDTIYRIETARQMPKVTTLFRLAGGLGVRPGDLLEGIEWRPRGAAGAGKSGRPVTELH